MSTPLTRLSSTLQPCGVKLTGPCRMPTFIILKNGREINRIRGADGRQLQEAVKKLANEAETVDKNPEAASSSSGPLWYGAGLPKGYADVTDQVEIKGLELLNADPAYGGAKTLFDNSKPSGIANADGKGKGRADSSQQTTKDWVESDTDEQLMLYIPFMSSVKIHTLLLTSLPPSEDDDPMRPRTIRLFTNSAHNLGFEEAEDMTPTQGIELAPESFDKATGTAKVELRFVKFAKCSSLVLFVVNGEGDGEKVRIDRLRVIGESGVSREMGKLEKIGDAPGE